MLLISALGAFLTALFTGLLFWTRHELPDIVAKIRRAKSGSGEPDLVTRYAEFNLEFDMGRATYEQQRSKWVVDEICIVGSPHKWLALAGPPRLGDKGQMHGYRLGGAWTDTIRYYPPVPRAVFLIHPAAPAPLILSFRVRLRFRLSVKRRVDVIPSLYL